jgi:hypothetical protein
VPSNAIQQDIFMPVLLRSSDLSYLR